MDEQVKQKLLDYLTGIEEAAGDAKQFIIEQAPKGK